MPSDLHPIGCACRDCCAADNRPNRPHQLALTTACLITACLACWGWIIAPLASALFPDLAF